MAAYAAMAAPDLFGVPFADTIVRDADLSRCGSFRWTLTRTWTHEGGRVRFIGLNPSTADHRIDDATVRRRIHFARAWGYGGIAAVNPSPHRPSTPAACRAWSRWQDNGRDRYARPDPFRQPADGRARGEGGRARRRVPGRGRVGSEFVDDLVEAITSGDAPWPDIHGFGRSGDGSPTHPMARGRHRTPDDARPQLWRAARWSPGDP